MVSSILVILLSFIYQVRTHIFYILSGHFNSKWKFNGKLQISKLYYIIIFLGNLKKKILKII